MRKRARAGDKHSKRNIRPSRNIHSRPSRNMHNKLSRNIHSRLGRNMHSRLSRNMHSRLSPPLLKTAATTATIMAAFLTTITVPISVIVTRST